MNCSVSQTTVRLCGLCVFYLIYLFIGAAIFSSLEYANEKSLIDELKTKRQQFLLKNKPCLNGKSNTHCPSLTFPHNKNSKSDSELEAFISKILEANSRGISAINNLKVEPNWSFGQAVFFSGTVLTTIGKQLAIKQNFGHQTIQLTNYFKGYGHVSPLSPAGKIFCIIFALFGIPLTLVMISACVERLLIVTNKLYEAMKKMSAFADHSINGVNLPLLTYTHLLLVFAFVLTAYFLIPAAVFSSIERDWDYLDALYYCFISLSTIGLGDYIPGDSEHQNYRMIYKIATTCKQLGACSIWDSFID